MIMKYRNNDSLIDLLRRLGFGMVCMLMRPVSIVASAI